MAGAIIASVIDEPLRSDLQRKGPEQAAKFSWKETATETALVYDLVGRGARKKEQ